MEILEVASALLNEYPLCDNCLGRQFAMLGHGLSNEERGSALKLACIIEGSRLAKEEDAKGWKVLRSIAINGFSKIAANTLEIFGLTVEPLETPCYICGGTFTRIDDFATTAVKTLSQYDYDSFLVGIKSDAEIEEREDLLRSKFHIKWGENIRNEFSREIGKRILMKTKKNVDLRRPDIVVMVSPRKGTLSLQINSLFIAGSYRKLVRGIPQSRWICSECRGRGCPRCNWKGQLYPTSVEELIADPLLTETEGTSIKLHAAGREDIDVRTLGSGRPFIAEVKKPKLRRLDLVKLRETINREAEGKIEVDALAFTSKEAVRTLKEGEKAVKIYRAVVAFARNLSNEEMTKIEGMNGVCISQVTPLRVAHRRAKKTRKRYIYGMEVKKVKPNLVELLLRCEGGLYIKELIHGDEGRTKPSVTEVVGVQAECVELDVMGIELDVSSRWDQKDLEEKVEKF